MNSQLSFDDFLTNRIGLGKFQYKVIILFKYTKKKKKTF